MVFHGIAITRPTCVEKDDICRRQGTTCYQKWAEQRWVWHLPGGGEAVKALLSFKTILELCHCLWMHLRWIYGAAKWTSDECLACVQLASFTSVSVMARGASSRVSELWITLNMKVDAVVLCSWRERKLRLLLLSFPSIFDEYADFFCRSQNPLPFFSVLTLSPKESGLSWPANQSPESIPGGFAIILGCCFRWGLKGGGGPML